MRIRPITKMAGRMTKNRMPMYGLVCIPNRSARNTTRNTTALMVVSAMPTTDSGLRISGSFLVIVTAACGTRAPLPLSPEDCQTAGDSVRGEGSIEVSEHHQRRRPWRRGLRQARHGAQREVVHTVLLVPIRHADRHPPVDVVAAVDSAALQFVQHWRQ